MPDSRFYNLDGTLTRYALACGYIESAPVREHDRVTLWREHGVYHVRDAFAPGGRDWRTFDTLKEARKAFRAMIRKAS